MLLGAKVWDSPTPRMMTAAFEAMGVDAEYRALSAGPKELPSVFQRLKQARVRGLNVTMPYKTSVPSLLSSLDESASRVGAVNTVKLEESLHRGYNTDVEGILSPLHSRNLGRVRKAVVLGTGGASRAFVAAMHGLKCKVLRAASRDPASAGKFASDMRASFPDMDLEVVPIGARLTEKFDVFFNASPCGSDSIPIPSGVASFLEGSPLVFDAVYLPVETELIRRAKERRCPVVYGHEMLVHQGAEAVRIWTGRSAPLEVMKESLMGSLGARA